MKLRDLDASFCSKVDFNTGNFYEQESIDGAQGVMFDCPLCHRHSVICWFKNPCNAPIVPADMQPGPGRWEASGASLDDLTLDPSVNLDVPRTEEQKRLYPNTCLWHGWVRNGDAA